MAEGDGAGATGAAAGTGTRAAAAGAGSAGAAGPAGGQAGAAGALGQGVGAAGTLAGGGGQTGQAGQGEGAAGGPGAGGQAGTLAGGAPGPDTRVVVTTTWPEDWRTQAAGGDAKLAKSLETIADPSVLAKSYAELRGKLSSGELKAPPKPLAADAKPEEIVAWRKEQALPETAEAYVKGLKLPDGLVPGENDSPLLASFADAAYKNNWTGEQYAQAIGWFYAEQDRLAAIQKQNDVDFQIQAKVALERDWGTQFKENQGIVTRLWDAHLPKDFQAQLLTARLDDGTVLGDNPVFLKAFLEVAKIVNPAETVTSLPAGMSPNLGNVEGRMGEIEKMMRAPQNSPEWRGYWQSEKTQAEYRSLVDAQQAMRGRQAA